MENNLKKKLKSIQNDYAFKRKLKEYMDLQEFHQQHYEQKKSKKNFIKAIELVASLIVIGGFIWLIS